MNGDRYLIARMLRLAMPARIGPAASPLAAAFPRVSPGGHAASLAASDGELGCVVLM